jgi:hypothetical protein
MVPAHPLPVNAPPGGVDNGQHRFRSGGVDNGEHRFRLSATLPFGGPGFRGLG